jgi:hypothetical protein
MLNRQVSSANRPPPRTIACINMATVELDVDFKRLISALQKFLDDHFVPIWGTPAKLVVRTKPLADAWHMWFLDDANHAHSLRHANGVVLGTHYFKGKPSAKVFVKSILKVREKISVAASHELAEMLVDPTNNRWVRGPKGLQYAYETSDVVEEVTFPVDGLPMCNFVYPAYFELVRKPNSTRFDHRNEVKRPFQILPGGFSLVRKGKNGEKLIMQFGSAPKKLRFAKEDRRLHRSEHRKALHAKKL